MSRGDRRHLAIALLIVAAGALLRGAFAILVPLFEVESYYWLWSRELAWGYYDHPPMLALVMNLSPLLNDSALGLRIGHLLLSTLGSLVFYAGAYGNPYGRPSRDPDANPALSGPGASLST